MLPQSLTFISIIKYYHLMKKLPLDLKQVLNAKLKLRRLKTKGLRQKLIPVKKLKGLYKEVRSVFSQLNTGDCTNRDSQLYLSVIQHDRQHNLTHIILRSLLYYKAGKKAWNDWEQGAANSLNDCSLYPFSYLWIRISIDNRDDFQLFADLVGGQNVAIIRKMLLR
jgi:hypothetical protein